MATRVRTQVGALIREWRQRRRLSQLELALDVGISARHLSFVETGRSRPSPELVLALARRLQVPYRERNRMLLAAGYAPVYRERSLDDPEMGPVRQAVDRVLAGHEPYPAIAVDRAWNLVAANAAVRPLLEGASAELLEPPVNVLRLSLHPDGLAPRIENLDEWSGHLLDRLGRQVALTGDDELAALYEELSSYPGVSPATGSAEEPTAADEIVATLRLRTDAGTVALFSTVTTFGTAVDITTSELAIEAFFPADEATARVLGAGGKATVRPSAARGS
jgi:transcriptional regulator with XRE-family HTH domain